MTTDLHRVEQRARELALVAEGVMDAGFESLGRRSRVVADDLVRTVVTVVRCG